MPSASPKGFTSLVFGGLNESLKLPLHEAVRRECVEREPRPFVITPWLGMLPMLGNLCMVDDDGGGTWNASLTVDVEASSLVGTSSCTLSAIASIVCSPEAGEGMKNFALAATAGLTDGIGGDWNKFAGLPPPWLKVSTYLQSPCRRCV